ncbi:MAG: allantoinase PuuE [Rhodospirillaceae bacterium]|nr:allantoinase PuuE [Rhodospirillaceae bacterium]
MNRYPRDLHGYGATPPDPQWPNGARIAVQFVMNYEEGGENNILHGDAASEAFLSEVVSAQPWPGQRHWNIETMYEYGARVGFWRLHRLFTEAEIPITVYAVGTALERSPGQTAAMQEAGWEIASHGHKWIEWKDFPIDEERRLIEEGIRIHTEATGERPLGWYTGRGTENTLDLLADIGGFAYTADSYADELPYWHMAGSKPLLVVPYTLEANDMRFATAQGFNSGDQFFTYLKDSFDALYAEGEAGSPKMLSIGLHCRIVGRPGRIQALKRFVEYVQSHDAVWFARRVDIANHWHTHFPPPDLTGRPSNISKDEFVAAYGGIFEHSPWVAERAHALELGPAHDTANGLHNAMARVFRAANEDERLGVLTAHPDLAGKLAQAKRLTDESTAEQASAGLDALTDDERANFEQLNTTYRDKFGFPFIIAVKGLTKADILAAFERRVDHDRETEFAEACRQVERIALLRLKDLLDD